jgi:hypothetical protein
MVSLFNKALDEWTRGLDPRESRVSIFEHIRDIPYSLVVPMTDPKTAPEQILFLGKGYCGPKHYLLAAMYRKLGLDVVYATFPFIWNDPDIHYPAELRQLASAMPVAYHLACRVRLNGRWILADATWDLPLVKGGFMVNEHWDGFSETRCAVKPLRSAFRTVYCRTAVNDPSRDRCETGLEPLDGEENHWDEEGHSRNYHRKTTRRTPEEIERIARFYPEFEAWLKSLRRNQNQK